MRRFISLAVVLSLLAAVAATAQVRGRGRLQGTVVDQATGKPVAGAKVTVAIASENTQPIITTTDAKGRWSALGLITGMWNIDIEAAGYQPSQGSANVSESQTMPPIRTALTPAQQAQEPAQAELKDVGTVPDSVRVAITTAQELLVPQAGDMIPSADPSQPSKNVTAEDVKENGRKAAALIEDALPQIPSDTPELQTVRTQVIQVLAQAYYKSGNLQKAIENLEKVHAADSSNVGVSLLLVNLYLEAERLADGKAIIEQLPAGTITDPTVYLNVGILFMNNNSVSDALTYFEKAVALDASRAEAFYYRGLANLQLKKMEAARADFQKVIALAPDSSEGRDAKQLLSSFD